MVELAAQDRRVALVAAVKDTKGADDEGLLEFHQYYFNRGPIYQDDKWKLFFALGEKKVGLSDVFRVLWTARKRFKMKNIKPSAKNLQAKEGWMAGGFLIFDRKGELVCALEEHVGEPLDMDQFKRAVREARRRNKDYSSASSEFSKSSSSDNDTRN